MRELLAVQMATAAVAIAASTAWRCLGYGNKYVVIPVIAVWLLVYVAAMLRSGTDFNFVAKSALIMGFAYGIVGMASIVTVSSSAAAVFGIALGGLVFVAFYAFVYVAVVPFDRKLKMIPVFATFLIEGLAIGLTVCLGSVIPGVIGLTLLTLAYVALRRPQQLTAIV